MQEASINLQSILFYLIFKTLQLMKIENLEEYYNEDNKFYDIEELEEYKQKAFSYYSKYLLNEDLIFRLEDEDKTLLNMSYLFLKRSHNLFLDKYNILFKEVFNKDLDLSYLVYSIVLNDGLLSFIIFSSIEDKDKVKDFLKSNSKSSLTLKNFIKLDTIKDKSFYFNDKELELLEDIDKTKYSVFDYDKDFYNSKILEARSNKEDKARELDICKEVLEVLDSKIDLFKTIMTNNSLRINKSIKLSKTCLKTSKINKVSLKYLSNSSNRQDLDLFIKFFEDKEDYKELQKDLEVLNILDYKKDKLEESIGYYKESIGYYEDSISYYEDKIEELEDKEDYFKFSSLLNLDKDTIEDYDNFNYNSYYKEF